MDWRRERRILWNECIAIVLHGEISFGKKESNGRGSMRRKEKMSMCETTENVRHSLDSPLELAFASCPPLWEVPKLECTDSVNTTIYNANQLLSIGV